MTDLIEQLIEDLRNELKEYGEMLALLEEQQDHLLARRNDHLLDSVTRLNAHTAVLRRTRTTREKTQFAVAHTVGHADCTGLLLLINFLPEDYRPLLVALVEENNQLLTRVQQRSRQNFLLLSQAVEMTQRIVQWLTPGQHATVYSGGGVLTSTGSSRGLYEAVG